MTLSEAITILEEHNSWRRGNESAMQDPKQIGIAMDTVLAEAVKGAGAADAVLATMSPNVILQEAQNRYNQHKQECKSDNHLRHEVELLAERLVSRAKTAMEMGDTYMNGGKDADAARLYGKASACRSLMHELKSLIRQ